MISCSRCRQKYLWYYEYDKISWNPPKYFCLISGYMEMNIFCASWDTFINACLLGNSFSDTVHPRWRSSWVQHWTHLGPVGPRWVPCWPHESCYHGWPLSGWPNHILTMSMYSVLPTVAGIKVACWYRSSSASRELRHRHVDVRYCTMTWGNAIISINDGILMDSY